MLVVDNCTSAPCQHGLSCNNNVAGFDCACVLGYTGPKCESGDN